MLCVHFGIFVMTSYEGEDFHVPLENHRYTSYIHSRFLRQSKRLSLLFQSISILHQVSVELTCVFKLESKISASKNCLRCCAFPMKFSVFRDVSIQSIVENALHFHRHHLKSHNSVLSMSCHYHHAVIATPTQVSQ